jgi:hypothetical protein
VTAPFNVSLTLVINLTATIVNVLIQQQRTNAKPTGIVLVVMLVFSINSVTIMTKMFWRNTSLREKTIIAKNIQEIHISATDQLVFLEILS